MLPKARRWTHATLLLLGLSAALSASGCIGDVSVPACFVDDSCGDGGAGDSGSPTTGGTGGTTPTVAGSGTGGKTPSTPEGGVGGSGDSEPGGGMGGIGGEMECGDCVLRPPQLAPPCEGARYEAPLAISGGKPPFRWQVMSTPPGWSIIADPVHPEQATLTSEKVAAGTTKLVINVTDSNGAQESGSFTLTARTACWFAFTALGEQGPELGLLDPFTSTPTPVALTNNSGVYDFQFSPNGKYLAYRFGANDANPRGTHLALVELATLEDQPLSFGEDRIEAFAWSPDSTTLAVAFKTAEGTFLTAVPSPTAGSLNALAALAPTPAFVESDLFWVGNRFVAYHAALVADDAHPGQFAKDPLGLRTAFYAELGANGFGTQGYTPETFPPDVVLQPSEKGFFMITGDPPFTIFTPLTGDRQPVTHWSSSLVSPSGEYSALLDGSPLLQILAAADGYWGTPAAAAAEGDECPMPLAWAKGTERIACLADVANAGSATTHGEVRIFDMKASSDVLEMSTLGDFCNDDVSQASVASCATMHQGYGYGTAQASGAARAFSASGRWFAFASLFEGQTFLYTADLEDRPITLKASEYFPELGVLRVPTRLAFSPDEQLLLFQRGGTLALHNLRTGLSALALGDDLAKGDKCSDNFAATPNSYCGDTERQGALPWSADSRAFAFRTPGALTIVDATNPDRLLKKSLMAAECATKCSGQFAFQPQPYP